MMSCSVSRSVLLVLLATAARQAAAAQKKAASEAKIIARQAKRELEEAAKVAKRTSRSNPVSKIVAPRPKPKPVRPATPEPVIEVKSRSGRAIKQSARLRGRN